MTRDDLIKMARQYADEVTNGYGIVHYEFDLYSLEKFALLLTSTEREACAYRAGIALLGADRDLANRVDYAIRERGAP